MYNVFTMIGACCLAYFTMAGVSCPVNDPECPGFTNTTLAEVEVEKVDKTLTMGLYGGGSWAALFTLKWCKDY